MAPFFTPRAGRPTVGRILPTLLVGGYLTPDDVPWLADDLGVRAVLSLQEDADLAAKRLDGAILERAYAARDIAFARLPVPDGDAERLAHVLPDALARLRAWTAAGRPAYVHCNAGMNRAPTVVIAYLHVHEGLALADAIDVVQRRHPCVPYRSVLTRLYGADALPPRRA